MLAGRDRNIIKAMTDLSPATIKDLSEVMRQVIQDTVPGMMTEAIQRDVPNMISTAIKKDVPGMISSAIKQDVPSMIRAEIRSEVSGIKAEVTTQGVLLRSVASNVSHLKNQTRKLGVLYEDLESRFDTVIELIEKDTDVRSQVKVHETRISDLETGQAWLKRHLT